MGSQTDDSRSSTGEWTNEDQENGRLLEKLEESPKPLPCSRYHRSLRFYIFLTGLNISILCLTIASLLILRSPAVTYLSALKITRAYSPVYKTFNPDLQTQTLNGSFFNHPKRLERLDPAKEMDSEWNRISDAPTILLTRSEILAMNLDPKTRTRASPALLAAMNLSATSERYHGTVDVFHQIHCLNMIRKHSYWDTYYAPVYGSWDHAHDLHWTHLSHCFDMLLQNLKCQSDVGVVTHVWMEGQGAPFPDFNMQKKCADFEGLVKWNEEHGVPPELVSGMPSREDIEVLYEAPPEMYVIRGAETPEGYVPDHEVVRPEHWYSSW